MNKAQNFNDKVITEVDEEKENEEEFEDPNKNNDNLIMDNKVLFCNNLNNVTKDKNNNIQEIKITIPNREFTKINNISAITAITAKIIPFCTSPA